MDPRRTCSQCGRTFSRREHCARHMLIHGNTRPYTCEFCDYSFQRHDAMLRHKEKFCTNRPGAQARSTAARQPSEKPKSRVRVACQQCHSKKLKCNGADPCQNCARKQVDCAYFREQNDMHVMTLSSRPGREAANQSESSSFVQQPNLFDGLNEQYNLHDSTGLETPFMEFDSNLMLFDTDSFLWTHPYFFIDPMDSDVVGAGGEHRNDVITNPNNIMASFENFMRFIDPSEVLKLDAQVNRYLQTPHISRPYDLNLLNILLTIFMKHISPMFRSFDGFHIESNTLPEQIIGASAIGALFTSVPGNMKVARMLYADCSRMVNSYLCGHELISYQKVKSLIQSYLLMELYGILSGQKRAVELSEAYHNVLIQEWCGLSRLYSLDERVNEAEKEERKRLFFDIMMLEALRFCLLQLPPVLSPFDTRFVPSTLRDLFTNSKHPILRCLNNEAPIQALSNSTMYQDIALIAIAAWNASGRWNPHNYEAGNRRWRAELIENALLLFIRHHNEAVQNNCSAMILCHMTVLSLHVSFKVLVGTANSVISKREKVSSDFEETKKNWMQSSDQPKAIRHAKAILERAHVAIVGRTAETHQQSSASPSESDPSSSIPYSEGPHDAICIYLAALTLWASLQPDDRHVSKECLDAFYLVKAAECLQGLKADVASSFKQSLEVLVK